MNTTDWIQLGSLVIAAVTLVFLVKYVTYTRIIAKQSMAQTEAVIKPAVIALHPGSINSPPSLRNIGKGPALDVEWTITGTNKNGTLDYLEPGQQADLSISGMKPLYEGAIQSGRNGVAIRCSFRSISGRRYVSTSNYNVDADKFSTTFEEN